MVEVGKVRISPPVSEAQYRSSAKNAAPFNEVPPTFRDFDETVIYDPTEIVHTLQDRAEKITEIMSELKLEQESLADSYMRIGNDLDREYNYEDTREARQFLPLFPAGKVHGDSIGLYFAIESEVASKRAKFWRAEHLESPNPFGEIQTLFELGFLPKGFRMVEGEEQFVIDVPMRLETKQADKPFVILGCWSPGDERVKYFHMPTDDCEFNTKLNLEKGKNITGLGEFSIFGDPEMGINGFMNHVKTS